MELKTTWKDGFGLLVGFSLSFSSTFYPVRLVGSSNTSQLQYAMLSHVLLENANTVSETLKTLKC